jgi:N-ethylmaleimide reductase
MFAQLWHPGRFSHVSLTGGAPPVSASVDPEYWQNPSRLISTPHGWIQPSPHRAIEKSEIPCVLELYSGAVKQARAAGFDGVEVHAGITKPYPRGALYACVGKEMRLANEFCAQHDRSK